MRKLITILLTSVLVVLAIVTITLMYITDLRQENRELKFKVDSAPADIRDIQIKLQESTGKVNEKEEELIKKEREIIVLTNKILELEWEVRKGESSSPSVISQVYHNVEQSPLEGFTQKASINRYGDTEEARVDFVNIQNGTLEVSIRSIPYGGKTIILCETYNGPNFEFDSSTFDYNSLKTFMRLAALFLFEDINLTKLRDFSKILVLGFTDPAGTEDYNDRLSRKRARYVKEEILLKVCPQIKNKIRVIGHGERLLEYPKAELLREISIKLGLNPSYVPPLDFGTISKNIGDPRVISEFKNLDRNEREARYKCNMKYYQKALKNLRVVYLIGIIDPMENIKLKK